jgi:hypothetical protein
MYKNKSPMYWDLLYHGIDSKPMSLPFDEWTSQVNRLKGTQGGFDFIAKFGKDAGTSLGLKPIYELSWWGAWEMDKIVRFATANYLMRKMKMNVSDAARMSAVLHSDYANVPMATRRGLNRVLFTGTFKVTMFRLYKDMIKNMVKVPYNLITRKGATTEEKVLAKAGYTTLLGALGAFDLFMTAKGYERDQFARRYFMPIQTEKGPKESVVVFSNPLAMIPKYAQTITKLATEDYKDDKAAQLIDEFKYDIHPVYRITTDIIRNKKADGSPIWTPFADTGAMKYAKILEYASKEVWAMYKAIGMEREPEDQRVAWQHFKKEWGDIAAYAASPTSFTYLRDPSVVKYVKELQRMQRKYRSTIEDMVEDQTYDPKKAQQMQQELVKRSQRILQLLQNAQRVNDRNTWERYKGDM